MAATVCHPLINLLPISVQFSLSRSKPQRYRRWSGVVRNSNVAITSSVTDRSQDRSQVDGLWQWLVQTGVISSSSGGAVQASLVENKGIGLFAQRGVRKGEEVVHVAKKSWMSVHTARESGIGSFLKTQRPWVALALYLIAEDGNPASIWRPYLDSLPRELDSTLFWTDDELRELEGTQLLGSTLSFREYVKNEFAKVEEEIMASNGDVFDEKIFTLEAFLWAFGILRSRTFAPLTGDNLALVPLADLVNHGGMFGDVDAPSWEVRRGTGLFGSQDALIVRAMGEVQAGEEILMEYGAGKGNAQLVLDYGFVEKRAGPSYALQSTVRDTFALTLEIPEGDNFFDDKADIVEINGLDTSVSFDLVSGQGPPEQLLTYLRLMVLDGPDAFLLEALFRDAVWGHVSLPVSRENEEGMCAAILSGCEAALAAYTTSIDEDVRLLEEGVENSRLEMAIVVRLGEKRVLQELQGWFEAHMTRLDTLEYYAERRLRDLGLLDDKGDMTPWVFGEG